MTSLNFEDGKPDILLSDLWSKGRLLFAHEKHNNFINPPNCEVSKCDVAHKNSIVSKGNGRLSKSGLYIKKEALLRFTFYEKGRQQKGYKLFLDTGLTFFVVGSHVYYRTAKLHFTFHLCKFLR